MDWHELSQATNLYACGAPRASRMKCKQQGRYSFVVSAWREKVEKEKVVVDSAAVKSTGIIT